MKTLFTLTVGLFAIMLLPRPLFAGAERLEAKEMAPPPAIEQPCNWTGFYIGAQGGYGWGDLKWTSPGDEDNPDEFLITEHDHSGFFVGGEEGYNYQIGWLVLGAEGDFSYSDVNGEASAPDFNGPGPVKFKTGTDWVGSVGLRAGVAFHRFLFFAKGGVSFAHLKYSLFHVDTASAEEPHTETFEATELRTAPMVGGGVEYALSCHWSAKVEYKHLFLGRNHIHGVSADTFPGETPEIGELEIFKSKAKQDLAEVGLNYKF